MSLAFLEYLAFLVNPDRRFPKFEIGELAFLLPNDLATYRPRKYLVIKGRRWARTVSCLRGVWAYDGTIFEIDHDKLVPAFRSSGINFPEELLKPIDGT